jgi:hypothetical protein
VFLGGSNTAGRAPRHSEAATAFRDYGLGCGVGRALGMGVPLGVGVGRGVAVGVAVGVGDGVPHGLSMYVRDSFCGGEAGGQMQKSSV